MPLKVLIIDDNSVIRQVLRLQFEQRGWNVEEAKDAYEGLTKFRENGPQLVTLDLIMPINNGIGSTQLAKLILEEDPQTTLLVVSSLGDQADLQDFFQKCRVELFTKANAENPTFDALFERVGRLSEELNNALRRKKRLASCGVVDE